ncbi:MAG: ArsC family transcriptional regulator [Maricaulis sp.]|nr:ArsC family transcriptional regulator [Maricaulis sp.]
MSVTIYGLKNCDTCRKAVKELETAGLTHRFVDIREEADNVVQVPRWLDAVGAKALVNTRSTTWRNMTEEERAMAEEDPAGALISSPTLIKRPVIETRKDVRVGWGAGTLDELIAVAAE